MFNFTITNNSSKKTRQLKEYIFDLNKLKIPSSSEYTYLINCLELDISNQKQKNIIFQITRVNSLKELLCLK